MKKKGFKYLIGIAIMLALPWIVRLAGESWVHMLIVAVIFGSLAVSLNLLVGYTGQMSLAHIAFFGVGAYTSALLVMQLGVNCWLALLVGGIISIILALFIGWVSFSLRGIYFALVSFSFLMLIFYVFKNLEGLTGGTRGLFGIPYLSIGGFVFQPTNKIAWFYLVGAFLLLTYFIVDRVINSRAGRAFIAIREDEDLAKSSGINTFSYKMLSLSVSVFLAAIAGGFYVFYMSVLTPNDCAVLPSIMVIAMCAVGGLGTMVGPLIGAVIVTFLPEALRAAEQYYYLIFGFLIILMTIFAPYGVMGVIKSLRARRKVKGS